MTARKKKPRKTRLLRRILFAPLYLVLGYLGFAAASLTAFNVFVPPTTGVQLQRRVEAFFDRRDYEKRYDPVGRNQIHPHLRRAIVAAEDARFYQHWGIDWEAIREAMEDNRARGRSWRGGSTITQQLVKNLFMTTHPNWVRKGLEVPLSYLAELLLPKERILTLYLNVIEWGDGVYGAEAAAQYYYNQPARELTRRQAAALAAVVPAPRRRSPNNVSGYAATILTRMSQMGW